LGGRPAAHDQDGARNQGKGSATGQAGAFPKDHLLSMSPETYT